MDWKEDYSPHPPKPGEESSRGSRKGKERASLGSANGGADAAVSGGVVGPCSPVVVGKGKGREKSDGGAGGGVSASGKKKRKSGGVEER